jgi:hypothetical protein
MAGRIAYYGGIVTNGLVLNIDAANKASYPGNGTVAFDISPINTNCSLSTSGVTTTPLPPNFNQTVTIPSVTTTRGLGQSGTIDFWFQNKIPVLVGSSVVLFGNYLTSFYFYRNVDNANNNYWHFSYYGGGGNSVGTNTTLTPNTWYNMVVTLSNTGQYAHYINGVARISGTIANFTSWNGFNGSYTIGSGLGAGNMGLGSMKMYNRFLSAAEVLQNYNATKGRYGL